MNAKTDHPYALFMLVLSMLSLLGLGVAATGRLSRDQVAILQVADLVTCAMFFLDFLNSLYRAPNRRSYFLKWGWLDLVSSIPMIDALRVARVARIFRIVRVIRGVRATKILAEFILDRRAEGAFLAVTLLLLLLIVSSSIAILQFETQPDSNIRSAGDAAWWAIATLTTVGYGDVFPVTWEGRIIASALMLCGIGLLGAVSGLAATWFLGPSVARRERVAADLLHEIQQLASKQDGIVSQLTVENAELKKALSHGGRP